MSNKEKALKEFIIGYMKYRNLKNDLYIKDWLDGKITEEKFFDLSKNELELIENQFIIFKKELQEIRSETNWKAQNYIFNKLLFRGFFYVCNKFDIYWYLI